MKKTDLREYKLVGTFGDAQKFKRDYNHIMTAFSGSGYTIAVHTVDEDLYKLSEIKHDKITEIIISSIGELGIVRFLKKESEEEE